MGLGPPLKLATPVAVPVPQMMFVYVPFAVTPTTCRVAPFKHVAEPEKLNVPPPPLFGGAGIGVSDVVFPVSEQTYVDAARAGTRPTTQATIATPTIVDPNRFRMPPSFVSGRPTGWAPHTGTNRAKR